MSDEARKREGGGRLVPPILIAALCCLLFLGNHQVVGESSGPDDTSFADSCDVESGLPANPGCWTTQSSQGGASQSQKTAWCEQTTDRGRPLPEVLRSPHPISELELKNSYDAAVHQFAKDRAYLDLGWQHDASWRFTGPYVGESGEGSNFGTHMAIRIAYSPEVIDWLCKGRSGTLPDGAMIVKETARIDKDLDIVLDDEGGMVITGDPKPSAWTIMVKQSDRSFDGWYWLFLFEPITPQLEGRSGLSESPDDFYSHGIPPTGQQADWYPTGAPFSPNSYGGFCIQCHAVGKSESTFVSLDNLLGHSLRYRKFNSSASSSASDADKLHSPISAPPGGGPPPKPDSGLSSALSEADQNFLKYFAQSDAVSFARAWELRLPGQVYDHVISDSTGPAEYLTSDQCWSCHGSHLLLALDTNMAVPVEDDKFGKMVDLSPHGEWRASPMGLSGRDPIFFSQLQGETNRFPELKTCIENTCLHCHGVMGERQLAIDIAGENPQYCDQLVSIPPPPEVPSGKPFTLDTMMQWPGSDQNALQKYAALARDGVSCTVCHRMAEKDLGKEETFTGNFIGGPPDKLYGPYNDVTTSHMSRSLGITPEFGEQIKSADLCASCHNVLLPTMTNEGQIVGHSYEQATHLEWTNSDYAPGGELSRSCQDCHMPKHYKGEELSFRIANAESDLFPITTERLPESEISIPERSPYARHSLHGLNLFFNQMAQQFPLLLGIGQMTTNHLAVQSLLTAQDSMADMARSETATVSIEALETTPTGLHVRATVDNKAGHNLPSGVSFRRMFLEVLVLDDEGEALWASGRTNEIGAILDGTSNDVLRSERPGLYPDEPVQPHYQTITRQDQVQIYQELYRDSAGKLTTGFLQRYEEVKDNRIRPHGYDPDRFRNDASPYIAALADMVGEEKNDPDYTDRELTGSDTIEYRIRLKPGDLDRAQRVKLTLYSQSIPPFYLEERFADAKIGAAQNDQIDRLFYIASHLNVEAATDDDGRAILSNWKLYVTSAEQSIR